MRKAFLDQLTKLALNDKDIYLITADTGFKVFDEYQKVFADRYLNIGISESAMISMASGLALEGKKVFCYGIVPFVVMRCFEQIRNDLCMQNLPVTVVGVGGGLSYGSAGGTHHSIEDLAIMSALPNMTVIAPGDPVETSHAVFATQDLKGPLYLRLGKSGEEIIHQTDNSDFKIGRGLVLNCGEEIAIISTGNMLAAGQQLLNKCERIGLNPWLVSMHTIKPFDDVLINELSRNCKLIISIEEHSTIGGLGSQIANAITENNLNIQLKKFGINDQYANMAGSHEYLREYFGLTAGQIFSDLQNNSQFKHLKIKEHL